MSDARVIALAGNPNSGKTTLFNRLTGLRQRVGNYPGVTVEKKSGAIALKNGNATIIDLPGTYSLVARSRDESIAFDVITRDKPSLVVVVLDASNLERNLYLALQILELGRPVVIALNMIDVAEGLGLSIDAKALSDALGVPVVPIVAANGTGVDALIEALNRSPVPPTPRVWSLDAHGEEVLGELAGKMNGSPGEASWLIATVAAARDAGTLGTAEDPFKTERSLVDHVQSKLQNGASAIPGQMIEARYAAIGALSKKAISRVRPKSRTLTDRVDGILLHRVLGPLALVLVLGVVFQSIFTWAEPLMDLVEGTFAGLGEFLGSHLPEGALRGLLVDGVIAGVGAVLVFIPQIAFLFFLLGVLEDSCLLYTSPSPRD